MKDGWNEMSYNKFPSFYSNHQRAVYEQWCKYIDNIENVNLESGKVEHNAWLGKANSCIYTRYCLFL